MNFVIASDKISAYQSECHGTLLRPIKVALKERGNRRQENFDLAVCKKANQARTFDVQLGGLDEDWDTFSLNRDSSSASR
jgi:hypothetical protein